MDWLIGLWLLHGGASVGAVPEAGSPAIEVATPRRPLAKRTLRSPSAVSGGVPRHRLVVKFVDDARMRLDAGRLASRSGRGVERLLALAERLGLGFTPLVPWSEARLSAVADVLTAARELPAVVVAGIVQGLCHSQSHGRRARGDAGGPW